MVNKNTFARSSSYIGTNLVVVTKQDESKSTSAVHNGSFCGEGIEVSYNKFTSIVGTCMVDTGLVRLQCN
jgi:hypothetical protein